MKDSKSELLYDLFTAVTLNSLVPGSCAEALCGGKHTDELFG